MSNVRVVPTQIQESINELGLRMEAHFVPFSKSHHSKDKDPSLNWDVIIFKGDRPILTTAYWAGCGHCLSYKQGPLSVIDDECIRWECERGRKAIWSGAGVSSCGGGRTLLPDFPDVLYSLLLAADAIDYGSFEEWASDHGENHDSISAERTYNACLQTGLKLRSGLGEAGLAQLNEAFQDY